MRGLRQLAIERFAYPRPLAEAVNEPKGNVAVYALVAALLAGLGSPLAAAFRPWPHRLCRDAPGPVLIPVFSFLSVLPLVAVAVGASRAWDSWFGTSLWSVRPRRLWHAVRRAAPEIVAQRKLSGCQEAPLRPWAHHAVMGRRPPGGVGGYDCSRRGGEAVPPHDGQPAQESSPTSSPHCLSAARHISCGCGSLPPAGGERVGLFDLAFLANVLLAGVTGVATEVLRVADSRSAAYPVFFVHLVVVLVLMLTLPYTKSPAVYRVMALAGEENGTEECAELSAGLRRGILPGSLLVGARP